MIIALYNRPSADDYSYTIITHEAVKNGAGFIGVLKAAVATDISFYKSWQGVYSSAFIWPLTPSIVGEKWYPLCTYIIMAAIFVLLLVSVKIICMIVGTDNPKIKHVSIELPLFITTYIVLCMPSAVEGLFWYNGAVHYIPFTLLTICNAIIVFWLYQKSFFQSHRTGYRWLVAISVIISFVISGGNQTSSFANILILIMLLCYFFPKRNYVAIYPLVSAIAGFVVMYVAPGTAIRQSVLQKSTILETIYRAGFQTMDAVLLWLDFNYVIFLLICTPFLWSIVKGISCRVTVHELFFVFVAMIVVISGMFSAPYYSMSSCGPDRLINAVWIVFIFFSLVQYTLALAYLKQHCFEHMAKYYNENRIKLQKIWTIVFVAGCLLIFGNPGFDKVATGRVCADELFDGTAKVYAQEMDSRIQAYRNTDTDEVCVPPLSDRARSCVLNFIDLSTDPDYYYNSAAAQYYSKSSIYVSQ
ncbi:MAG: DUF6056 family protein [Lachnoclostridium sp.]|nr:DUF6056 family protein [Lachnospira sp.]MCM1247839.1 DUF6056 family protein [Lachnoclostridium sp.]MCM1534493.1 DUF6056 family protein [Clostridium sp.]